MASSETTQILFNSPALRSLKRDQLIKLCKVHSIKASGKNVELVQRLRDHASTLPHDSPLSVAARSEQPQYDKDSVSSRLDSQRASEQWEVVMEDIPELPEGSSRATLSSLRSVAGNTPDEFGTGAGSKSSSVSSSLRAIANSFNFIRAPSNKPDDARTTQSNILDELAAHSVPYSSIPEPSQSDMPQTDHFKFSTPDSTMDEHIPGLPGHLSMSALATAPPGGTADPPKNTIRLVSALDATSTLVLSPEPGTPQLRPVDPPFDLVMGSPDAKGQSRVPVWPLSPQPGPSERLYPALPADELEDTKKRQAKSGTGNTTSSQPPASSAKVYPKPSNRVQDLFSPAPKLPSKQEETVGIPRSEPFLFGSPLPRHSVSKKAFDTAAASVLEEMNKRLSAAGVQKVETDVFGTIPTTAITKADSGSLRASCKMDRFDKVHEGQFNKMDSIANHYAAKRGAPGSKKRKSDVLGNESAPTRNRPSSSTASRKRLGIPGGFDDEEEAIDDVQEEGDRRMSKRVRVLEDDGGKDKGRRLTILPKKTEAEAKQTDRERAAMRKMLEERKEKRRSSRHGRTSLAGPQAVSNKGKATPRFGFLSSAKLIVRNVWNFGIGSPSKLSRTNATMTNSAAISATESKVTNPAPTKKPSLAPSRPSESLTSRKTIAFARTGSTSGKALKSSSGDVTTKGGASHSRPPSRSGNTGTKLSNLAPAGSTSSRQSVRASSASSGNNDKASIFGANRTTSRLFAPTASSLARTRGPTAVLGSTAPATAAFKKSKTSNIIAQRAKTPPRNAAVLDAITNSPHSGSGGAPTSPRKIFTTPLLMLSPVRPTSLAAAATSLATTTVANTPGRKGTQSPERPPAAPSLTTTMTTTKMTTHPSTRKPRISRSRIIAKLGAQRAAAASTTTTTTTLRTTTTTANSSATLSRSTGGSRIPRASGNAVRSPRVRSSMGTATRRSYAGAKSASRGSDVLMSAKKHVRQSEYVRRRSRLAGSAVGAGGLGGGGSYITDDGSMAMEIDED